MVHSLLLGLDLVDQRPIGSLVQEARTIIHGSRSSAFIPPPRACWEFL
ncbi:hypothetical protein [[Phormidium] sp. ETS-05]|nr:hypothetical protein [[Phormidium] sp. ETS-05]